MSNIFSFLSTIIALPFLGLLFALVAKDDEKTKGRNVYNVTVLTIVANIILIWRIFSLVDVKKEGLQLIERFTWLENPQIDLIFGVDVFSLLLILAIHFALLIALSGVKNNEYKQKAMMVFSLLFLSMITGFLVSADIFSFYIFFEAMLLPLFMLIGMFGEVKRQSSIYRFFIYNLLGAAFLFVATTVLYNYENGMFRISSVNQLPLKTVTEYFIWTSIFLAFLSRIPIWPFHYWISSINSGIRNPLVFIISNLIPMTGVYGFIRFLPDVFSPSISFYIMILEIVCIVSMLFIALIGFINKDVQYKIFSFMTVYYIIYLLCTFLKTKIILWNIGFSFFSFLIIITSLEVLLHNLHIQQEEKNISCDGILCTAPKLSFVFSFLVLASVGLPLSSLFLNNLIILSSLFNHNIKMGVVVVFSIVLVCGALLNELYRYRNNSNFCNIRKSCTTDIEKSFYGFMIFIIFVLLMSFIKPLWFLGM